MRSINRLNEPDILKRKGDDWKNNFVLSDKSRPDNSKYGHPEIKASLEAMSFHKCYYCERELKGTIKEIDHFIEVAERRDLAFEWTNLYLACDNCNGKFPNSQIPVAHVIDPCNTTDEEIEEHLTFEDEQIKAKNNSAIGLKTIQKYKLNSDLLDRLRGKRLNTFYKSYCTILDRQKEEGRKHYLAAEKEIVLSFKNNDMPYSLMFKLLINKINL